MIQEAKIRTLEIRELTVKDAVIRKADAVNQNKEEFKTEAPGRYEGQPTDGKFTVKKAVGHMKTILHHKKLVAEGCFQVGLYRQGVLHDMSKFQPEELLNGFRFYQGGLQSPNNGERVVKGHSDAWIHHKGRNRHHYEYWTDYNIEAAKRGDYPIQPVQMPRRYVAEMLMDRIAASKTYMKDKYSDVEPLRYFQKGKAGHLMHPVTADELEFMLRLLARKGEAECFRFVKGYYLKGGNMDIAVIQKQSSPQADVDSE